MIVVTMDVNEFASIISALQPNAKNSPGVLMRTYVGIISNRKVKDALEIAFNSTYYLLIFGSHSQTQSQLLTNFFFFLL